MLKIAFGIAIGYIFSDFIDELLDRSNLTKPNSEPDKPVEEQA